MRPNRLSKRIFFETILCVKTDVKNFTVKQMFESIEYQQMFANKLMCNLTIMENKCKDMQNVEWNYLIPIKPVW